jgi:hypothetical protein
MEQKKMRLNDSYRSMIIFLFSRLLTPSWISCSLLFSCTRTVCFLIH